MPIGIKLMTMDLNEFKDKIMTNFPAITGNALGALVGSLVGGPEGAALGGALGEAFKAFDDVLNRQLSDEEKERVAKVTFFAVEKMKTLLDSGKQARDDWVFGEKDDERSNAKEIFEGVLLKSKMEHEEKKIRLIANVFANLAFEPDYSSDEANNILQGISSLTYRKICILALLYKRGSFFSKGYRIRDYLLDMNIVPHETASVLHEILELHNAGLVISKDYGNFTDVKPVFSVENIVPAKLFLSMAGSRHCLLLGVDDIPEEELLRVLQRINGAEGGI